MKIEAIQTMLDQVEEMIHQLKEDQEKNLHSVSCTHKIYQKSAANLLDYLSLRSHDLRELQRKLGYLGISRLARAEAHTMASLETTRFYLKCVLKQEPVWPKNHTISIKKAEKKLAKNTSQLFGEPIKNRRQRIMVTMPGFASEDIQQVEEMIKEGLDVARINCAHDDPDVWLKIIQNIKTCDEKLGTKTIISMDISGPKIRTGEIKKSILIEPGDDLLLYREAHPGKQKVLGDNDELISPAGLSCTLPEVFDFLKVNDRVYFDDGIIKGKITSIDDEKASVKIMRAKNNGAKLKADNGINFPDSSLAIQGLTQVDKENLNFIAAHADIVNFSFVNSREDVAEMHQALTELDALGKLGIVYKIETRKAYKNMVSILLEAMKAPKVGVMIARGDLAIETGWNEIGQIQKEMLAICNACHIPIIWATQVLENLAKKGLPSRSEITDTVNATKADCIMLNKGTYILKAIQLLNEIIVSMEMYQDKNAPILPKFAQ